VQASPLSPFLATPKSDSSTADPVDAILDAVRDHLGMEIAFAGKFADDRRIFTHIRSDLELPAKPGDSEPLNDSFCYHILKGRLPELIHDAQKIELAKTLPFTSALPIGAHLNVPLTLSDGSVYGTFCCLSRTADPSLTERDLNTLKAFAALAAVQIENQRNRSARIDQVTGEIGRILDNEQVSPVFQPIHSLVDGSVKGVESLSRFPRGLKGFDIPSDWFNAAAEIGKGEELELLAVRKIIAALDRLPKDIYVSINVSPETAIGGGLEPLLKDVPKGRIVVELTEHSQVADFDKLARALDRLRGIAKVAIDDVGAGYSGLRHIVDLRPDILKLDMQLTRQVDTDAARHALAQALVAFAGRTGSEIIAEGIETAGEADTLRKLNVKFGQGYYFSRPMPLIAVHQYVLGAEEAPDRKPYAPRPAPSARSA